MTKKEIRNLILGIFIFLIGVCDLILYYQVAKYDKTVAGTVLSCERTNVNSTDDTYSIDVEYEVNGEKYQINDMSEHFAQAGSSIIICYDEDDPAGGRIKNANEYKFSTGCLFAGVGLIFIVTSIINIQLAKDKTVYVNEKM